MAPANGDRLVDITVRMVPFQIDIDHCRYGSFRAIIDLAYIAH